MLENQYHFYIIYSVDQHGNNSIEHIKRYITWLCGFQGSNATLLIGIEKFYIWTDSRYYYQAKKEINHDFLSVKKENSNSNLHLWINKNISKENLSLNPCYSSIKSVEKLSSYIQSVGGSLLFDEKDIIQESRHFLEREIHSEKLVTNQAFPLKLKTCGLSSENKIKLIRKEIKNKNSDLMIITKLEEICWLLNIRGHDSIYTPYLTSYMIVALENLYFYVNIDKLGTKCIKYLSKLDSIKIIPYKEFYFHLETMEGKKICIDPNTVNFSILSRITRRNHISYFRSPIILLKSIKNANEIRGAKIAHQKDGLAMASFFSWLEDNWKGLDEISAKRKLHYFRSLQKGFIGESFETISAFGENSSIIHYSTLRKNPNKIHSDNLYLIDSGGQYLEGTTDITRTIHLGKPKEIHKIFYTLVLKGNLLLKNARFPEKTKGNQIDILARYFLHQKFFDYEHSTGHGVGSTLSVHEGPQNISPHALEELHAGMITSNEPGIYFPGKFGIRIENLCVVKKKKANFLQFNDLTLAPYSLKLIKKSLLNQIEIRQINDYHKRVFRDLSKFISNKKVFLWLKKETRTI